MFRFTARLLAAMVLVLLVASLGIAAEVPPYPPLTAKGTTGGSW